MILISLDTVDISYFYQKAYNIDDILLRTCDGKNVCSTRKSKVYR